MQKILCLFIGLLVFFSVNAFADNLDKEKAAVISAQKWLGLIDAGRYPESWKEAAEYFRNAIGQEQWEKSLPAVRNPLGKLVKRKVRTKTFQTSLPGAPDGEYVVIQFETSFENKKTAIETVTPMLEKDGRWRVAGYYIK
jgi:hypothetical protein